MKGILTRIEQNLAKRSSRRRFVETLGKAVAAIASIATVTAFGKRNTAYADDTTQALRCCEGTLCPDPHTRVCPDDTIPLYTWTCLDSQNNQNYTCTDCFQLIETTPYKIYNYTCTFALHDPVGQTN